MANKWFKELLNAYEGRPFVIVGGGPSAAENMGQWPDNAIVIAANQHGLKLGIEHDYTVAYDQITKDKITALRADNKTPAIIGQFGWADYQLSFFWRCNNSGILAAWCAFMMGANQVILTGMDLYQSGVYFWDEDAQTGGTQWALDYQLMAWQEIEQHCKGIEVRVLGGGPLLNKFPVYNPSETVTRSVEYVRPVMMDVKGDLIQFTRNTLVRGVAFEADEQALLGPDDSKEVQMLNKGFLVQDQGEYQNVVAR